MMISAEKIIERARKIVRLRKHIVVADDVDDTFLIAPLCARMSARWYARGNTIVEYEYEHKMFEKPNVSKIEYVARKLADRWLANNKVDRTWDTLYADTQDAWLQTARAACEAVEEFDSRGSD